MKTQYRTLVGYLSMFIGLALIVFAAYSSSETTGTSALRGATAAASAVGGSVLTFVVSRRMLAAPPEWERAAPTVERAGDDDASV